MIIRIRVAVIFFSILFLNACDSILPPEDPNMGTPVWAISAVGGTSSSQFSGVAITGDKIYAVGSLENGTLDLSATITLTGLQDHNLMIACFNKEGDAIWAKCPEQATTFSKFFDCDTNDSDGSIYAVGVCGLGTLNLGDSISPTGTPAGNDNLIIVKYNSNGITQWARTVSGPSQDSRFYSVAVGSDGIYAAADMWEAGIWDFGNSKQVTTTGNGHHPVIIKYDFNGLAQWAVTTISGNSITVNSISVCDNGIYLVGDFYGNIQADFGNSVTATGYYQFGHNPFVVKYSLGGIAQWALTTEYNFSDTVFHSVSCNDEYIYISGVFRGITGISFGSGVETIGTSTGYNGILVKFRTNGTPLWCRSVIHGDKETYFKQVTDNTNEIYINGIAYGPCTYYFGNGLTLDTLVDRNPVIAKYTDEGNAKWAKSTTSPIPGDATFYGIAIDHNYVYATGFMLNGVCDFSSNVRATGMASGDNFLLAKFVK